MTFHPGAFLDLTPEQSNPATSRVVIVPVPYDETSTWRKGADRGPAALLEASGAIETWDLETGWEPHSVGFTTRPPVLCDQGPEVLAELVEAEVGGILDEDRFPVVIGGEHSVSIGAIRAAAHRISGLSVLQIDAHADTREEYEGSRFNHACVMARARQWCPISQVGLRSVDVSELAGLDPERVWYAHQVLERPRESWIPAVVDSLTEQVYLTIDLDAFDPSLLPATGTPEPGGLGWYDVVRLIDAVAESRRIVALDVVELCPITDHGTSAYIAARLVHRALAAILRPR